MRLLLVAFLSLALSACRTGLDLYSASDARPLLVPGTYRVMPPNEPAKIYRVSMLENGMTSSPTAMKRMRTDFLLSRAGGTCSSRGWSREKLREKRGESISLSRYIFWLRGKPTARSSYFSRNARALLPK